VTGRDLAQCCRDWYPGWTRWPNWLLSELAVAACDLAEVLGGAVERNRIKRRLREAVRQRRSVLTGACPVDVVINPKKSVLTLEFSLVLEEVGRALDAIAKKLVEK